MWSIAIYPNDYQNKQPAIIACVGDRHNEVPTAFKIDPEEFTNLEPIRVPTFSTLQ